MPYNNTSCNSVQLYLELLEILQDLIDTFAANSPIIILGDFNASLPQKKQLLVDWYKSRPFSHQSLLLYDFLSFNHLLVANINFNQKVNYTYFKGASKSYIDHCIVTSQINEWMVNCSIIPDDVYNCSDHFPVSVVLNIPLLHSKTKQSSSHSLNAPHINWQSSKIKEEYSRIVAKLAEELAPPLEVNESSSRDEVQSFVDTYCNSISNVLLKAAKTASDLYETVCKKKTKILVEL